MNKDNFYSLAVAYDIAFSEREFDKEAKFIEWVYENFSPLRYKENPEERNFLELGCGPARHSIAMAKIGWKVSALDMSDDMIAYAENLADKEKAQIKFIKDNMITFESEENFSVIGCFTESITHILTNDDMLLHLNNVAKALKRGGLYIIENAHPRFFFPLEEANFWEVEKDDIKVKALFGTTKDVYDYINQIWEITVRLIVKQPNQKTIILKNKSKHRWYLSSEYDLFYRLNPQFNGFYLFGGMSIPPEGLNEESEEMIVCFRKK